MTPSRPAASAWSASRSASIPPRPLASSCSMCSARSPISRDGSSPNGPATASPKRDDAVENPGARRSIPRRFRRPRNSSKPVCRPLERKTDRYWPSNGLQTRCRYARRGLCALNVILGTNLPMSPLAWHSLPPDEQKDLRRQEDGSARLASSIHLMADLAHHLPVAEERFDQVAGHGLNAHDAVGL